MNWLIGMWRSVYGLRWLVRRWWRERFVHNEFHACCLSCDQHGSCWRVEAGLERQPYCEAT